jgi:hypothetical protein
VPGEGGLLDDQFLGGFAMLKPGCGRCTSLVEEKEYWVCVREYVIVAVRGEGMTKEGD